MTLTARVHNGQLVLSEPTDLPDGEVVEIAILRSAEKAGDDGMDAEEVAALEKALEESERQFAAGEEQDFFETIAELRSGSET